MLKSRPFFTFLAFFLAAFVVHAITTLYIPQYTEIERFVSSILIAMGMAFSIPFMFTESTTRIIQKIPQNMRPWFTKFEIIVIFAGTFLSCYYEGGV